MTETDYFGGAPEGQSEEGGTWFDMASHPAPFDMLPGLNFRPVAGSHVMLNLVHFEPNVIAPVHSHDEEQLAYVLEGELEFEVGGEARVLTAGMGVVIPPNVPHGARTYDSSCLAIDAFGPPRQALLQAMQRAIAESE